MERKIVLPMIGDEVRVNELLRAGRLALAQGDKAKAHTLWKQAAALRPHDEAIWRALLEVVSNHDDRRVCLENILTINPQNEAARRQLRVLSLLEGQSVADPPKPPEKRQWLRQFLQIILTVLLILLLFILGMIAGSILNLL